MGGDGRAGGIVIFHRWTRRDTITTLLYVSLGLMVGRGVGLLAQPKIPNDRPYHLVTVVELALGKVRQTHIHVEAWVTYTLTEEDGDEHIRGCDSKDVKDMDRTRCAVFECIPELPCTKPPIGSHISVDGIARFDKENGHRWSEVHPVEHLTILKP